MHVVNKVLPDAAQMAQFLSATEDGPFVMVNLLKFKPFATYEDGSEQSLTGAEAYARYGAGVAKLIQQQGGRIRYNGPVTGLMIGECSPLWDLVALAEYPSLAAFRAMVEMPEYAAIAKHRIAGLEGQLNIKTKPMVDWL